MKVLYLLYIIITVSIVISCEKNNNDVQYNNMVVITCRINDKGFSYHNHLIRYNNEDYLPIKSETYKCNNLSTIDVYQSEGAMSYSRYELSEDSMIAKSIQAVFKRKIIIRAGTLYDNTSCRGDYEIRGDSLFVCKSDTLWIYVQTDI
jgi:hypothetical protein